MARISPLSNSSKGHWSLFILTLMFVGQPKLAESNPTFQHTQKSVNISKCQNISKTLLHVVTETLSQLQKDLKNEFNCTYNVVDPEDVTKHEINTLSACLPGIFTENSGCMTMNGTAFIETTCLKTIHADLKAFKYELQDLNPSLNEVINELMQALKVQNEEEKDVKKPPCSSFSCKMKQCGVILYFRLRTVTVSRMLNFLKSSKQGHSPM